MDFDISEAYEKFLSETGNAEAAATLALAATIQNVVCEGALENAVEYGVRFGLLGDSPDLFDVIERFLPPLPWEEPSPEPADVDAANRELAELAEEKRISESE